MKIWVDDVRPAPADYIWIKSVNEFKEFIVDRLIAENFALNFGGNPDAVELIDLDHDAGDFAKDGGDYIKILDWLESISQSYPIRIHSMNPVGVSNMRAIIRRNGWKEVA